MTQARCPHCGRWFKAEPGMGERQVTCLRSECQAAHKKVLDRRWHTANPERTLGRQGKVRAWADGRGYWKAYREEHPGTTQRNREQTRERMCRRRQESRQAHTILADPAGYLRGLRADVCKTRTGGALGPTVEGATVGDVCKTRTGNGAIVGMMNYLIAREVFAKHEELDTGRARAG